MDLQRGRPRWHRIVGGRRVRCLTAEIQVLCHAGYELDDDDFRDMRALHERFGVDLLPEQTRC